MIALLSLLKTSLFLCSLQWLPHETTLTKSHMMHAFDINALNQAVDASIANVDAFTNKTGYLVIGKAGHGKSTTINYLLGNEMKEIEIDGRRCITSTENEPEIGHALYTSQTSLVKAYKVKNNPSYAPERYYFDTPGYDDTSEYSHEVMARSLAITLAARQANILGILVVIDIDHATSTSGRSNDLKDMMDIVLQILPDVQRQHNTKLYWLCTKMGQHVDKQYILNRLQEIKKNFSNHQYYQTMLGNIVHNQDHLILIRPTGEKSSHALTRIEKKLWACSYTHETKSRRTPRHTHSVNTPFPCHNMTIPSNAFQFSMDSKTSLRFTAKIEQLSLENIYKYHETKAAYENFDNAAQRITCKAMIAQYKDIPNVYKALHTSLEHNAKAKKMNTQQLEKLWGAKKGHQIANNPHKYWGTTIKQIGQISGITMFSLGAVSTSIGVICTIPLFMVPSIGPYCIISVFFSSIGIGAMYRGWHLWDTLVKDGKVIEEAQTIQAEQENLIANMQCADYYKLFTSKAKSFCDHENDEEIRGLKRLVQVLALEDYGSIILKEFLDVHAEDNAYLNIFCEGMDKPAWDSTANKEEM